MTEKIKNGIEVVRQNGVDVVKNHIPTSEIGKYGKMVLKYLEKTQPIAVDYYNKLLQLNPIWKRVNEEAIDMKALLLKRLKEQNPQPETNDIMKLTKYHTRIDSVAEEIVLADIVYQPHVTDEDAMIAEDQEMIKK